MAVDRTNLSSVWTLLFAHLKTLENTVGAGSTLLIRKVAEGEAAIDFHPIPYLLVKLETSQVVGRVDTDKQWEAVAHFRIVSQTLTSEAATAEILSKIAQVEDKLDAFVRPAGFSGFENSKWETIYDNSPDRGNLVVANCRRTCTIAVARGAN